MSKDEQGTLEAVGVAGTGAAVSGYGIYTGIKNVGNAVANVGSRGTKNVSGVLAAPPPPPPPPRPEPTKAPPPAEPAPAPGPTAAPVEPTDGTFGKAMKEAATQPPEEAADIFEKGVVKVVKHVDE